LADLDHVTRGELLEVRLITTRPVSGLFGERRLEHLEDLVQPALVDDVADTDQVDVLSGNLDDQVALRHVELEVRLLLALDDSSLDLGDGCGPVVGIDDSFADLKKHMDYVLPSDT